DNFREVLEPYIKSGLVTYKLLTGRRRQIDAYNMALHDYKHKFRYMAFIDADEFMFVRNNTGGRGGGSFTSLMISLSLTLTQEVWE
ncbi:MAG: glycosyltransferase family 92 protein, partial [Synergistaceae bacterium]|nr:glycosyltransferase family 92 protein [Synergistaceae bacterium]